MFPTTKERIAKSSLSFQHKVCDDGSKSSKDNATDFESDGAEEADAESLILKDTCPEVCLMCGCLVSLFTFVIFWLKRGSNTNLTNH